MIDMHSHILPEMDDGSKSAEMSQQLLEMLSGQGVTAVMATPHFYASTDNPEEFFRRRAAAVQRLGQTPIPVLLGAEVAYFDGMGRSEVLQSLCLGDTRLLLVEMPYGQWSSRMIREVCDLPVRQGVIPVLAHVDRYRKEFSKNMEEFLQQGVLFQYNADVFLDWRSRGWALKLLSRGHMHFIGSDCHNLTTRLPQMGAAAQVIQKKLGAEALENLTAFTEEMLNRMDN